MISNNSINGASLSPVFSNDNTLYGDPESNQKKSKVNQDPVVEDLLSTLPLTDVEEMETEQKRNRVDEEAHLQPEQVQQPPSSIAKWNTLDRNIGELVVRDFSPQELLAFERVCRRFKGLTERRWKALTCAYRYNYAWEMRDTHGNPIPLSAKDQFRLGNALHLYMADRYRYFGSSSTLGQAQRVARITESFGGVMEQFPLFGTFVSSDLSLLNLDEVAALKKKTTAAGNLILQGILRCNKPRFGLDSVSKLFSQAIQANATCASLYFNKVAFDLKRVACCVKLAFESIDKSTDYRGLEYLLTTYPDLARQLYDEGKRQPPILLELTLYDEAFQAYLEANIPIREIPTRALYMAAKRRFALNEWNEAEVLFEQAFAAYNRPFEADVYYDAAITKCKLAKWKEAEPLCEKAVAAYEEEMANWGHRVPIKVYQTAAVIKFKLAKWSETEALFAKGIIADDPSVPAWIYQTAAKTKLELKKWREAEYLYERGIIAGGASIPGAVYCDAALVKCKLKKWRGAEALYAQAIVAYGPNVPALLYQAAALLKFQLAKWGEAEALFGQAIAAYGASVPGAVYYEGAKVKYELEKWSEADDLYAQAIVAYDAGVPVVLYEEAAETKRKLEKWSEAEVLYAKAIVGNTQNISMQIYIHFAETKVVLQKWREAEYLYARVISIYGARVPATVYNAAAAIKCKLEKVREIEDLYIQALNAYGIVVPAGFSIKIKLEEMGLNELLPQPRSQRSEGLGQSQSNH